MAENYSQICAMRSDYEQQIEILVSTIYHKVVRPGHVVIDGGANMGMHTFPLARLVGEDGAVHAFEPILHLTGELRRLARSFNLLPQTKVYGLAVGSESPTQNAT